MKIRRRDFLKVSGAVALSSGLPRVGGAAGAAKDREAVETEAVGDRGDIARCAGDVAARISGGFAVAGQMRGDHFEVLSQFLKERINSEQAPGAVEI